MQKIKNTGILILLFINLLNLKAQSYVGSDADNYAGVHSLMANPSNVVDSRYKADINLASFSSFFGSNYVNLNFSDILSGNTELDFDSDIERFPMDSNNFIYNIDVLGPSFMFNLSPKSSLGVLTRVRGIFNLNNINGELFENLSEDFDTNEDFDFNSQNLSGTIHAWAEIGLVYGRVLINSKKNFLKGGVTLKYLQGAGGLFTSSPEFTGSYDATNEILATTGSISYGTTQNFDNDNIEFNDLTSGFGADIGFIYEYRTKEIDSSLNPRSQNKYKFKIAAAITDIGSIDYAESTTTAYNLNATADTSMFDDEEDVEDFLDNYYTATETTASQKIHLPTALRLLLDYQIKGKLYVSAQGNFSLVDNTTVGSNNIINSIKLSPRLETKWFNLSLPVSFREYGDTVWGFGVRLGPLIAGSGSLISNLLTDNTKTTDAYLGLKIPIYQKKKL